MNEKVADYLKKVKEQELIKRKLYTVHYYTYNDEYAIKNRAKLTYDEKTTKYYEVVIEDVTDEEYELILKHEVIRSAEDKKKSALPQIYNVLAVIFSIVGFIIGVVWLFQDSNNGFLWLGALSIWSVTFIFVLFLVSIGKIISLLEQIRNK
jgi:hypothetical protein